MFRGRMSTVLDADGGVGRKGKLLTPTGGEGKSQPHLNYSPSNNSTMGVRFEAVDDDFFNMHGAGEVLIEQRPV